jgi:hypothetical protein
LITKIWPITTDTVRRRVDLHNLEVDSPHTPANLEDISFPDRPVSLEEVGAEVDVEQVAGKTLDRVGEGEDVDPSSSAPRP